VLVDDGADPLVIGADGVCVGAHQRLDVMSESLGHERRTDARRQQRRRVVVPKTVPRDAGEAGPFHRCTDVVAAEDTRNLRTSHRVEHDSVIAGAERCKVGGQSFDDHGTELDRAPARL
jgi:hypothetical protein